MKLFLFTLLAFIQLGFLTNSDAQLLSQNEFDELSKKEAMVYAIDKFSIGSLQRNFEKREGLTLIQGSNLFSDPEKKLFAEAYELAELQKVDSIDLNNVRQLYLDQISKFEASELPTPPLLWQTLVAINQKLQDEPAMIECTEKLGKDDKGELLGSNKVYYYNSLADQAIMKEDYDSNMKYMKLAIESADTLLQETWLGRSYFLYASELYYASPDSSIIYAQRAKDVCGKIGVHNYVVPSMLIKAIIEQNKGREGNSLKIIYDAIAYAEINDSRAYLIDLYIKAFNNHISLKQFDQAEIMRDKFDALIDEKSLPNDIMDNEINKARWLIGQDRIREGLVYLYRGLELGKDADSRSKKYAWLKIAEVYNKLEVFDSTYYALQKLKEYNVDNDPYHANLSERMLLGYYIENRQLDKAEKSANAALEYAIKDSFKIMEINSYRDLAKIHFLKKDYEKAYSYSEKFIETNEFRRREEVITEVAEARKDSEFELEKNRITLENEKEILAAEAQQTKLLAFGGTASIGLLFLAGLYFLSKRKNRIIEDQNEELQKLNNVKDQLFQIIGHDVRKPAIAFRNVSKNLNYLIDKGDMNRLKQLGKEIDHEGKNLYNLTDNLLHWALMQKDLLSIKPVDINVHDIVAENIELFRSGASQKGITISNDVDANLILKADENSLNTIIRNLLDNALKYTATGGTIKVVANMNDNLIDLSIIDDGDGMSQSEIDEVLNDDITNSTEGTASEKGSGLGMKIIKSMLDRNNGRLLVDSIKGKGSTITISLPVAN